MLPNIKKNIIVRQNQQQNKLKDRKVYFQNHFPSLPLTNIHKMMMCGSAFPTSINLSAIAYNSPRRKNFGGGLISFIFFLVHPNTTHVLRFHQEVII